MKIFIPLAFSIFILFQSLAGCSGNKLDQQVISRLDSLYTALENAKTQLMQIDSIKVGQAYLEVEQNLEYLKENFRDASDSAAIILISRYRSIRKPLEKFASYRKNIQEEINFTRLQIENLKHDIENNVIDQGKWQSYYDDEVTAMKEIHARIESELVMVDSKLKEYDSYQPEIEKIIQKIKGTAAMEEER